MWMMGRIWYNIVCKCIHKSVVTLSYWRRYLVWYVEAVIMGDGLFVKCSTCGFDFGVSLGAGMSFPTVYQENVKNMKRGKLGEEAKQFFQKYPNGVINSESCVAKCKECGNYDQVDALTMYMPKEGKENLPADIGYIFADDINKSYTKYMDYPHKCSKCGGSSKVYKSFVKNAENGKLKCPKCKGLMGIDFDNWGFMWD